MSAYQFYEMQENLEYYSERLYSKCICIYKSTCKKPSADFI